MTSPIIFQDSWMSTEASKLVSRIGRTNGNPLNLRRWQGHVARVRANAGRARFLCIGDSKTQGFGAGSNLSGAGASAGAAAKAWPDILAGMLTARGLPASRDSCFGNKGLALASDFAAYDPRNTIGAGWSYAYPTLGGYGLQNSTNSNSRSFLPANPIDTVEIYSRGQANSRVFTVTADSDPTVLGTFDLVSASEMIIKNTVTLPLGQHKINLQRTSGQGVTTLGLLAYNSAASAVDVINAGWRGSVTSDHVAPGSPLSAINMLTRIVPSLVAIQLGTNDLNTNVPVETYRANIETVIVTSQSLGADVLLMYPTVGSPGYGTPALRAAYRETLFSLGEKYHCDVLDMEEILNGYSASLFYDTIHENAAGNYYIAAAVASRMFF